MTGSRFTHIVWDFNGTVFDDTEASVKSVSRLLASRGMKPITTEEYREVFDFPVSAYYKKIGFDLEKESFEVLSAEFFRNYTEESKNSSVRDGITDLVLKARACGIRNVILSATEKNMLRRQTDELGITTCFDEIIGLDDFSAKSKAEKAKDWVKGLSSPKILLVGDTAHDYETAKALGAECVLITGGHHSEKRLTQCGNASVLHSVSALENHIFNK